MAKDIDRKTELSKIKSVREDLLKTYRGILKSFEESDDRINKNMDYWDCFNCELGGEQYYNGTSQAYVPIVHDAIEARKTRFTNQVFPQSGNYIEVVTDDEELPHALVALIDHYIDRAHIRDLVIPALFVAGDIEGQYSIYCDWRERKRYVTTRVVQGPSVEGLQMSADDVDEDDRVDDIREEVVHDFGPHVEIIPDNDLMIVPMIADSIDDALYTHGGSVTILRRWSKAMIRKKIDEGAILKSAGEDLLDRLEASGKAVQDMPRRDTMKDHVDAAGAKSGGKYALVYETWKLIRVDDVMRLTQSFFGGDDLVMGCRLNPFWCDLCPLISAPVDKIGGSFKGISKVAPVEKLQYAANDYLNEGADSAHYALMPIIMTNPLDNPRTGSMVLDLAAVWEVNPQTTKFAEFPPLWRDALALVQSLTEQIFRTLGVNPSMIAQRSSAKKPTQAEIASEQAIDILTTADAIIPFEAGILTPMIQRFMEYDAQFRKQGIMVKAFGREGQKSQMQEVPPQQRGNRIWFKWWGVEQARSERQMQLQMAGLNVLKEIPPQALGGRQVNLVPIIERFVENVFGPRLAPKIFPPIEDMIGMQPQEENQLLLQGFDLPVSAADDDREHIQAHVQAMRGASSQAQQALKAHIWKHQQQMAMKNQAHAQQMQQGGGQPGGGAQPRSGGMSSGPRQQGPAGMMHSDDMPAGMPRKTA